MTRLTEDEMKAQVDLLVAQSIIRSLTPPTPAEIAAHLDAGGAVEFQASADGAWVASYWDQAQWRCQAGQDVPRHGYRLVPLADKIESGGAATREDAVGNSARVNHPRSLPDGAPDVCVPSPWTDGAVICLAGDVPEGWEWHGYSAAAWFTSATDHGYIVEARPPAVMPEYATERVPLAHVIGRTLPDGIEAVTVEGDTDHPGNGWVTNDGCGGWRPLPVAANGTVEVLIDAPAPEPEPAPPLTVTVTLDRAMAECFTGGSTVVSLVLREALRDACRAALNEDGAL